MSNLTIRQLRYFEALSRHRHFGRAAEACAISQPALSIQMKELEAMLGAPLIERGARQLRLSELGEALAVRARDILRAVDEIEDLARASHGTFSGRLRIGVIPTVAPYLLPGLIQHLAAAYPELDAIPRETVTQTLVRDLLEGRLDLAIVALLYTPDTPVLSVLSYRYASDGFQQFANAITVVILAISVAATALAQLLKGRRP